MEVISQLIKLITGMVTECVFRAWFKSVAGRGKLSQLKINNRNGYIRCIYNNYCNHSASFNSKFVAGREEI